MPARLIFFEGGSSLLHYCERMNTSERDLELAHAAYAERSWLAAHEAFIRADEAEPLAPEDLELLTTSLLMLARDAEAVGTLERAHRLYVERDDMLRAARSATWIGMNLAYSGQIGPATGWLGRRPRSQAIRSRSAG